MHAGGIHFLREAQRGRGRNRAGIHHNRPLFQRLHRAVVAKHYALNRGGIGNAAPDHFGLFGGVRRRNSGGCAIDVLARSAVPDRNFMPGGYQPRGHGTSHDAQTEEGNTHVLLLRLSELDTRWQGAAGAVGPKLMI